MSVSNTNNIERYTGNGSQLVFPYTFQIFKESDLVVIKYTIADGTKETLVLNTDYTISGIGVITGGNVTLVTAPSSAYKIIIMRILTLEQTLDLEESGAFPAANVETAHDKEIMIDQQQQEQIDRSMKLDEAQVGVSVTLPVPIANKALKWNDDGTAIINSTVDPDDLGDAVTEAQAAQLAAETAQGLAETAKTGAETAETNAQNSAIAAAASAASVNLPSPTGNSGKVLGTNDGVNVTYVEVVKLSGDQTIAGNKTFSGTVTMTSPSLTTPTISSPSITGLVIENRTSDPSSPVSGQIWLRTDL